MRKTDDARGVTTYYVGSGLYELRRSPTHDEEFFNVSVGGRSIAQVVRTVEGGKAIETRKFFLHGDHLGSPHTITDEFGNRLEVRLYEPFGTRVSVTDPTKPYTPPTVVPASSVITRGLTGHEHEDDIGLINMRGRVYDPKVGRFLSADPVLGLRGQGLNRYSYVANDPINGTDPSGFCRDTGGSTPECGGSGASGDPEVVQVPNPFGGRSSGSTGPTPPVFPSAPKPVSYTPAAPINAGVGPISPLTRVSPFSEA